MRFLALDTGTRRTGVAYLDEATGIVLPLDTLRHASEAELVAAVDDLCTKRSIDIVVVGLPMLPSGAEGEQAQYARRVGEMLVQKGWKVRFHDERFTTPKKPGKHGIPLSAYDGDAAAACALLA